MGEFNVASLSYCSSQCSMNKSCIGFAYDLTKSISEAGSRSEVKERKSKIDWDMPCKMFGRIAPPSDQPAYWEWLYRFRRHWGLGDHIHCHKCNMMTIFALDI